MSNQECFEITNNDRSHKLIYGPTRHPVFIDPQGDNQLLHEIAGKAAEAGKSGEFLQIQTKKSKKE